MLRAGGGMELLDATGIVLGAFRERGFEERVLPLESGDRVVLFSDGFSEAKLDDAGDSWAVDTISRLSRNRSTGLAGLLASAAPSNGKLADDVTVMDIRVM